MPVAKKARVNDIHDIEQRLETIIHHHLLDMEENPDMYAAKDRLAAIQYIGMYLNRKFGWGEPEAEGVGSAVRKYAGAFRTAPTTDAARSRAATPRPARVSGGLALASTDDSEDDTAA